MRGLVVLARSSGCTRWLCVTASLGDEATESLREFVAGQDRAALKINPAERRASFAELPTVAEHSERPRPVGGVAGEDDARDRLCDRTRTTIGGPQQGVCGPQELCRNRSCLRVTMTRDGTHRALLRRRDREGREFCRLRDIISYPMQPHDTPRRQIRRDFTEQPRERLTRAAGAATTSITNDVDRLRQRLLRRNHILHAGPDVVASDEKRDHEYDQKIFHTVSSNSGSSGSERS